jgi:hypothetical protein
MNRFLQKVFANFNQPKAKRPTWFIDAKWLCALGFILVFAISLTSFNIMQLTSRERAVETLTGMIEKSLTTTEGNLLEKIENYKASLATTENIETTDEREEKSLIGQALGFFFPESDIISKPATELKDTFLKSLAVPVYEEGTSVIFTLLRGIDYATPIDKGLNKIPIYSDETHDTLLAWFTVSLIISLILLTGVVYFSWGWGKIFNPGLIMALTAAPGFLGYGYAHRFIKEVLPEIGWGGGNFIVNTFLFGIIETLEKNLNDIRLFQTTWFWIGIILMIIAIAGKIYFIYIKKTKTSRKSNKTKLTAKKPKT